MDTFNWLSFINKNVYIIYYLQNKAFELELHQMQWGSRYLPSPFHLFSITWSIFESLPKGTFWRMFDVRFSDHCLHQVSNARQLSLSI